VNSDVFNIVIEVWNSGKEIADVPPLVLNEEEPSKPENYDTDIKARSSYLQKMKLHNLRRLANHSQRCDVNYRLEIARAFMDEKFFFPHNMDFRGRAYPLPPHLNHMGNDLSRGLLLFADAKPLGAVGLRWLRIHLANVYGFDKASFSEREQFAIDHEEDIRKVTLDPLGEGGKWWLQADDPWQCLATCMELMKAHNHPEGPENYPCRLPVHQDGTCNGLQHYAALGGDMAGAKQVNLSSGDRPSDVYTAVADLVIEIVERDAALGNEAARIVQGKITRKVVKQTVMTTVYGVTFIGAKDQVARQLEDRGLPSESIWTCSTYLAKQIMACIGDLFSGAEAIQNWLTESALLIAKSIPSERLTEIETQIKAGSSYAKTAQQISKEQMTSVIWTTPLGLPVVQPYRKVLRKQVATSIQSVYIHDPYLATQVSPAKQASAFPPNFIHSLDATHMLLTALECQSAKLTFASVHDSYWTHPCDIETMSDIIRDTFVRLHSCDILGHLQREFLDRYKGHVVPAGGTVLVEETESGALRAKMEPVKFGENGVEGAEEDVEDEEGAMIEEAVDEKVLQAIKSQRRALGSGKGGDSTAPPKFVLLKDILPPIPAKGAFDVKEIKVSVPYRKELGLLSLSLCVSHTVLTLALSLPPILLPYS
jgi:DNA-directed RNA polymerase